MSAPTRNLKDLPAADQVKVKARAAEKVEAAAKLGSAQKRRERTENQRRDPGADRWKGQPPAITQRVSGPTIEVPVADDYKLLARDCPDLVEGFVPSDFKDSEYRLPAARQWFGIRSALYVMAAVRCGYDAERIPRTLQAWGQRDLATLVERSLGTDSLSGGGALLGMPEVLVAEFIPLLRKALALVRLGAGQVAMKGGQAIIAGIASGSSGGWVGEKRRGQVKTIRAFRRKMSSKKAYALTAISYDMLEEADLGAAMMLRDDLVAALAEIIEEGGISTMGTENSPRGMRYIQGLSETTLNREVDAFILTAWKRVLREKNVGLGAPRRIGTLMPPALEEAWSNLATPLGQFYHREEMAKGLLGGFPYEVSNFIPVRTGEAYDPTDCYHGDFSQLIMGVTRDLTMETSREADFVDEDGEERSAFLDEVELVKLTKKVDYTVRQKDALIRDLTIRTSPDA